MLHLKTYKIWLFILKILWLKKMRNSNYKYIFPIIVLIGILIGIGFYFSTNKTLELHLLHTNDLHAHLLPFNPDNRKCTYNQEGCLGGFATIKTIIDSHRQKHPDLVLLDAGDRFSGTVFYTLRKSQDIIPLMNQFQYDALTLGNHDFDSGLSEIEKMMNVVNAPVVSVNVKFPKESVLAKKIKKSVILKRQGQKIGIIGALTPDIKTETTSAKEIDLLPLVQSIQEEIDILRKQNVQYIILLTHIGFDLDKEIASQLTDVDIIVGGHSHTLLSNNNTEKQDSYPVVVFNKSGEKVLVVSAGFGGQYIGALSVVLKNGSVQSYHGDTIRLDSSIPSNQEMKVQIEQIEQELAEHLNKPIMSLSENVSLTPNQLFCSEECYIGEVLTDALKEKYQDVDFVFMNAGGIRSGLFKGAVSFKQLAEVYPFDSSVVVVKMTGEQVERYLQYGIKNYIPDDRTNELLQVAGLSYIFDAQKKYITDIKVEDGHLVKNKEYRVVLPSFLAEGGDGFPVYPIEKELSQSVRNLLIDIFQLQTYQLPIFEKRVQKIN